MGRFEGFAKLPFKSHTLPHTRLPQTRKQERKHRSELRNQGKGFVSCGKWNGLFSMFPARNSCILNLCTAQWFQKYSGKKNVEKKQQCDKFGLHYPKLDQRYFRLDSTKHVLFLFQLVHQYLWSHLSQHDINNWHNLQILVS